MSEKIFIGQEELDPSQVEARIQHLDNLLSSPGWKLMKELMEKERDNLVYRICQPDFPENETAFSRGAIFAANKFISLPENLAHELSRSLRFYDEANPEDLA